MAVQSFVKGDDLKKLIDDKLINAQSVKYVLRQKGILPVCTNSEALSDLIHHHFFGSATMTQMQEVSFIMTIQGWGMPGCAEQLLLCADWRLPCTKTIRIK